MQGDLIDVLGNIVEIKCMGMDRAVETNLQNNYQGLIEKFKEKTRVGNMMNCFTSVVSYNKSKYCQFNRHIKHHKQAH